MVVEVEHPVAGKTRQIGFPLKLSKTSAQVRRPAPCIGQDTEAILKELGYDADRIVAMKTVQAI